MGGPRKRNIPVLFQAQRGFSKPLGCTEGKSQEDDLPEDGKGTEKLWQDGRSQEDQEKAHLPVQWRGTWEVPHRKEALHVNTCAKKARKRLGEHKR